MDDRNIELRKLELAEKELSLKEREFELKPVQERNKSALKSPLGVAAVGGMLALLSGVFGNLFQGFNNARNQQLQHDADIALATRQHDSASESG